MYQVKLEKFEGPLDLLLQLIEKEDLDISQISLAKIADEFVEYVNKSSSIPPDELADFLLTASKLIYIKSKSLLPYLAWGEEEEDAAQLEEQLKLYRAFLEASKKIEEMIRKKNYLYSRERVSVPKGFYPPENLTAKKLRDIFAEILGALEPFINIEKKIRERVVSIKQKIEDLRTRIAERARMGFREFIKSAQNKTEVIVSFLALLELVKQRIVSASQDELFKDITIENVKFKNQNAK